MLKGKDTTKTISVIILNYQTPDLIVNLLKKIGYDAQLEIIIIDNSPDKTLQNILKKNKFIGKYYYAGKNLGFSGGNNFGLSKASGEWIFFLNSDTECTAKNILDLWQLAQKNNFVVAAPKLVSKNSQTQWNIGYFDGPTRNIINFFLLRPRYVDPDKLRQPTAVDLANGTALLVKRVVFEKISLWDSKNFFMYFEDLDLCYRLWRNHIKILYCPQVKIIHFGGGSSKTNLRQKNFHYQTSLRNYLQKHRSIFVEFVNRIFKFLT